MTIQSGRSAPSARPAALSTRRLTRLLATAGVAGCLAACRADAPDAPKAGESASAPAAPRAAAGVDTTVGGMRIVVADTVLTLSNGALRTTTSLMEHINSSGDYGHTLVDARRGNDGRSYLLILTSGLSRPHAPDGYCGAGEERNLVWLVADSTLRVTNARSELVDSCLVSREWNEASRDLTGQPLEIQFLDARDKRITTARYDRQAPERGIALTSVPDTITP